MDILLRQLALIPSGAELCLIDEVDEVHEITQEPPRFGNLPSSVYLRLGHGGWLKLGSDSQDVHFKFECLRLTIQRADSSPAERAVSIPTTEMSARAKVLFRADWLRPSPDAGLDGEWSRVVSKLSAVNPVPTLELSGCLSWWGLLLQSAEQRSVLIHLDDFPLSIRVTEDESEIASACAACCSIDLQNVRHWLSTIEGWDVEFGSS